MFLHSIASACLLRLAALSGAQPTNKNPAQGVPRVVGGSSEPASKFPFVGRLVAKDLVYEGTYCSAILVSPTVALTTAECLLTTANTWYKANLATLMFGGSSTYTASQMPISDAYNPQNEAPQFRYSLRPIHGHQPAAVDA
ncbi:hypothetical protein GGI12_001211 [Dipsacomyces acuminosporus]|nr:hypothetical protein GGI12_001211 [Dipsacomyces acuminosporus]